MKPIDILSKNLNGSEDFDIEINEPYMVFKVNKHLNWLIYALSDLSVKPCPCTKLQNAKLIAMTTNLALSLAFIFLI